MSGAARGELVGVGVSTFVEPSGGAGFESGTVRVERTGEITVLTGSSSHGQGHETVCAQIAADMLKRSMEHVAVHHGDTLAYPARHRNLWQPQRDHGRRRPGDRGRARRSKRPAASPPICWRPRRTTSFRLTAASPWRACPKRSSTGARSRRRAYGGNMPPGTEQGLQETGFLRPQARSVGLWRPCCVVSIDRESARPDDREARARRRLRRADQSDDRRRADSRRPGAGLGEALLEQMLFDDEGQVLTGTLMNYAVMRAADMPPLILGETVTPNPFQPVGRQGRGRGRHQRRAAGGSQCADGCAGAAGHQARQYAVHCAKALASDSPGGWNLKTVLVAVLVSAEETTTARGALSSGCKAR